MKKLLSILTALIMTATFFAFPVSAEELKLSKTSVNLPVGYSITLKVSGASEKVKWSVSNSDIASVKSTGDSSAKVIGKKTGAAYVYAKADGKTLKAKITVKQSFITPSVSALNVEKGKSKTVTLTVKGSKEVLASVDNKNVCSVSWGSQWDGDKIKLTVKAKANGTANVKIYTKNYSKSTAKIITVNVGKSEKTSGKNKSTAAGGDGETDSGSADSSDAAARVAELVNKERKAAGKSELTVDDTLSEIAALRAKEITKKFSHERPDGTSCFTAFEELGASYATVGENIAMGQKNADDVMNSWMNSSGHKANILDGNFTKIGIGCCESGGQYYWVQVFAAD